MKKYILKVYKYHNEKPEEDTLTEVASSNSLKEILKLTKTKYKSIEWIIEETKLNRKLNLEVL